MIILGINETSHDASVSLIKEGTYSLLPMQKDIVRIRMIGITMKK